jgi:hypothetical protein
MDVSSRPSFVLCIGAGEGIRLGAFHSGVRAWSAVSAFRPTPRSFNSITKTEVGGFAAKQRPCAVCSSDVCRG